MGKCREDPVALVWPEVIKEGIMGEINGGQELEPSAPGGFFCVGRVCDHTDVLAARRTQEESLQSVASGRGETLKFTGTCDGYVVQM